jgi:hypothetical protein
VVFWWTGADELSGKDGLLVGGFWGLWILQFFGIYFGARVASLLLGNAGFFASLRITSKSKDNDNDNCKAGWKRITFPPIAIGLRWMGHPGCCGRDDENRQQIPFGDDKQERQLQRQTRLDTDGI